MELTTFAVTVSLFFLFRFTLIDPYVPAVRPSVLSLSISVVISVLSLVSAYILAGIGETQFAILAAGFAVGSVVTTAIMPPVLPDEDAPTDGFSGYVERKKIAFGGSVFKTVLVALLVWITNLFGFDGSSFWVAVFLATSSMIARSTLMTVTDRHGRRDRWVLVMAFGGGIGWIMLAGPFLVPMTQAPSDYIYLLSLFAFWLGAFVNG